MAEQLPFGKNVSLAINTEPRCPCVLLIDVSGNDGDAGCRRRTRSRGYTVQQDGKTFQVVSGGVTRIDKVNEGLRVYHADLMGDSARSPTGRSVSDYLRYLGSNRLSVRHLHRNSFRQHSLPTERRRWGRRSCKRSKP